MSMDISVSIVVGVTTDKLFALIRKSVDVTYYDRYTGKPEIEKETRVVLVNLADQSETVLGRFYSDALYAIEKWAQQLDPDLSVDGGVEDANLSGLVIGFDIKNLMYGLYSDAFPIPAADPGTYNKEYGRIRELFGIEAQPYICVRISS